MAIGLVVNVFGEGFSPEEVTVNIMMERLDWIERPLQIDMYQYVMSLASEIALSGSCIAMPGISESLHW